MRTPTKPCIHVSFKCQVSICMYQRMNGHRGFLKSLLGGMANRVGDISNDSAHIPSTKIMVSYTMKGVASGAEPFETRPPQRPR